MLQLLKLIHTFKAHVPQQDKSLQGEAPAPQQRVAPTCHSERKPGLSNKDTVAKNKQINKKEQEGQVCQTLYWKVVDH